MSIDLLRPRFLPDRDAPREWGGKGSTLARMVRHGFRVPPTATFGVSEVRGWLAELPGHADALRAWREGQVDGGALAAFRTHVLAQPMPAHFPKSVETLRRLLAGEQDWPFILRSSMSAEDSATASLAGCFASVVVEKPTAEAMWSAFLEVVASALSESAARRVLASGVDPATFGIAVVAQPMLDARLAGVAFSRETVDPWSASGEVEWVAGPGEGLVQGTAETRRRRQIDGPSPELAPFWDELWTRTRLAERIVGGPADVEWVWDGETLWFVQARAVATEEARLAARAPGRAWSRELTLERFPEPLTPMGWSALQDSLAVNLRTLERRFGVVARRPDEMAVSVRGVIYSDPKFFSFPGGVKVRFGRVFAPWKATPWLAIGALARFAGRALMGRGGAVSHALLKLDFADALLATEARRIEKSWTHHRDGSCAEIAAFNAGAADGPGILASIARLGEISGRFMEPDLAVYLIKDTTRKALEGLWLAAGNPATEFPDLVRAFSGNRTLEMSREWAECVETIRADRGAAAFIEALRATRDDVDGVVATQCSLGEPARQAWQTFIDRNGHSTTSWDIAVPVWSDNPSRLADLLAASLTAPSGKLGVPADSGLRGESRTRFVCSLKTAGFAGAGRRVERALMRLENFMRMDEEHHFLSGLLMRPSRRLVASAGRLLATAGVLQTSDDAFYVTLPELQRALAGNRLSLTFLAERRRAEWNRARSAEPAFVLPTPALPPGQGAPAEGRGWLGIPMSPGVAVGRAAIAEHIEDARDLAPGSILVTTSPNPALTPFYPLLGGLISSTGGALSHGFVSAREYALPAVSGISRATARIPHGALIRVDGGTGRVELLEEGAAL